MKIDAHHHFWHPARGDYDWMPADDPILSRPYLPADLAPDLAACGIDGTVLVQAAPHLEETEYMLGLADATDHVRAVIGWIDFEDPTARRALDRLAGHPKFRGIRPMIQDIPDPDWMLRDDIAWAFAACAECDLCFEALGFPEHIANFGRVAARHPDLRIVYDHGMKPAIARHQSGINAFDDWARGITMLARETTGMIKLSGLVTEASTSVTIDDIAPFATHLITAFGPDRVMWGSDWPVSRLRCGYREWHAMAEALVRSVAPADQGLIFGATARAFYRI